MNNKISTKNKAINTFFILDGKKHGEEDATTILWCLF
jgi:hypothetical protein